MRTCTRMAVVIDLTICGLACQPAHVPATSDSTLLAADLVEALRDTSAGFMFLESDGTASGDSARRIASLALWDLEGGDPGRGLRLLDEAVRRGVPDPTFYEDAFTYLTISRDTTRQRQIQAEARRRWPGRDWTWERVGRK